MKDMQYFHHTIRHPIEDEVITDRTPANAARLVANYRPQSTPQWPQGQPRLIWK